MATTTTHQPDGGDPALNEPVSPSSADPEKENPLDTTTPPSSSAAEKPAADVPPNGGYGWVVVGANFFINCHTWGINSAYGVFLAHYLSTNSFPGATRLDYAFVGGLSISQALFISPLATTTTRLFGTRTTLLIGVALQTLSLIGASFAREIWQLFLSQGVCFGWGMGFLFVGSVGIVPQWFTTRRSLANGISTAGSGLGGLIYSLAANAIIQRIGIGWAFRILGILSGAVNFVCAILLRDRNKQVGTKQLAWDVRLFFKLEYWLLVGWGFFSMLGYIVLLFSLPNYASTIGLTPQQGSVINAILSLGQGLGRPPIGYFSDSVGRINMAGFTTFLDAIFVFAIWINAKSYGVMIFYALIGGTVAGTYWTTVAPVSAEVVGLRDLPAALSINWIILVLPTTFSEPIALEITASGNDNYLGAQLFAGFMYLAAAICMWFLRAWKIGEVQRIAAAKDAAPTEIDPTAEPAEEEKASKDVQTQFITRLFAWKKV